MTGNVAQVFLEDDAWDRTLAAARVALRAGGALVFEIRRPDACAWKEWNRDQSFKQVDIEGVGLVETWHEVIDVALPFVNFQATIGLHGDGTALTSTSTLRFRSCEEVTGSLDRAGFRVRGVRDAPDRPGKEYVVLAERLG